MHLSILSSQQCQHYKSIGLIISFFVIIYTTKFNNNYLSWISKNNQKWMFSIFQKTSIFLEQIII